MITPIIYTKVGCPWCDEVLFYFDKKHIPYKKMIVSGNAAAMAEMSAISGQTKAPTMNWDGEILADFGGL
jgi:glutaredoxin 3